MNNTGLWPRERPRPTDSHAELKVYDALSRLLPANWSAWHPLRTFFDGKHRFKFVRADSPEIGSHVVADSSLRFKGLGRPAVIVTILTDKLDVRVHIDVDAGVGCGEGGGGEGWVLSTNRIVRF
jgi:hypothetical protein